MPSFTISAIGDTGATVYVSPDTRYRYYRVYARLSSDPDSKVYDNWFGLDAGYYVRLSNLLPGTSYTVNVSYGTGPSAEETVAWIGAQTFTTTGGTTFYYSYFRFRAYKSDDVSEAVDFLSYTTTTQIALVTLSNVVPTRTGYTFVGWSLDPDDPTKTVYPAGWTGNWVGSTDGMHINEMYAVWQKTGGGGSVHIGNGSTFNSYTPYIWTGSGWQKATPYVWNGAWRKGV